MAARCMRGGSNQALGRKEKTNTWTDSKHFYTEESKPCTNFCVRVTPYACYSICEGLVLYRTSDTDTSETAVHRVDLDEY